MGLRKNTLLYARIHCSTQIACYNDISLRYDPSDAVYLGPGVALILVSQESSAYLRMKSLQEQPKAELQMQVTLDGEGLCLKFSPEKQYIKTQAKLCSFH